MIVKRLKDTLNAFTWNWASVKRALKEVPVLDLIAAGLRNIQFILFGNSKANRRLKVCATCEYSYKNFCLLCDCHIPAKVLVKENACPAGRWKE